MTNRLSLIFLPLLVCVAGLYPSLAQSFSEESGSLDYLTILADPSPRFDMTAFSGPYDLPATLFDEMEGWEDWHIVPNYSFGKDRGSLPMIADVKSLHPYFRDKVIDLIRICAKKGIELRIVESFRTRAKQAEYFGMGKKYTQTKGGRSRHQYGLAVDVVPFVNGEARWDNKSLWKRIGVVGESLGLRWGGRWESLYDPAHFEWFGGYSTYHLAKGELPPAPNPERYPCIEEDLRILKSQWEAWESEQAGIARETEETSNR